MGIRDQRSGIRGCLRRAAVMVAAAVLASGAVIDRVAVVVGNTAITETEVLREVRLTDFMNGQPLDLSPQQRRAAAERLVDQQLIRNEMATGTYPMPTDADADDLLRDFRDQRFNGDAPYWAALTQYGITEKELKEHLLWELAAIRFTDARFQSKAQDAQSANRVKPGTPTPSDNDVDRQLDAWLKEQRKNTRVLFKKAAFE